MADDCLAVIPARGGSKGIPGKNIRLVAGIPLIAYAVRAALASKRVNRVVVTTDSREIAAEALRFGAEVVNRPAELSSDTATSETAVLHCLDYLRATEDYEPGLVMLLQCTAPLTIPEDLDGMVETLLEQGADSCLTCVPFYHFLWEKEADGEVRPTNHSGARRKRRQDLEPQYLEMGAAYVMRTQVFRRTKERFCGRVALHVLPDERHLDIDSEKDLAKADALLRARGAPLENESLLLGPHESGPRSEGGGSHENVGTPSEPTARDSLSSGE